MYFWAFIYFVESSRVLIHPISSFHIYLHTKRQIRLPLPVRIWGFRCDIVIWRLVFFSSRCMRAKAEIIDLGVWAGVCVRFFFFFFYHVIFPSFHLVPVCGVRGWIQPPGIGTRGRGRQNTDILYLSWVNALNPFVVKSLLSRHTQTISVPRKRVCVHTCVCVLPCVCACVSVPTCSFMAAQRFLTSWFFSHLRSRVRIIKPISRRWLLQPVCDWITSQLPAISSSKGEKERAEEESKREMRKVIKRDVRGRRWRGIRQRDSTSSHTSKSYLLTQHPDAALPTFVSLLAKSLGKSLFLVSSVIWMFLPSPVHISSLVFLAEPFQGFFVQNGGEIWVRSM